MLPEIEELAADCGFMVTVFGSTLKNGRGHDLDLLFSPIGSVQQEEVRLLKEFGGVLKGARLNAAHNVRAFQVEKDGKLYDFVFGGFWFRRRQDRKAHYAVSN